MQIKTERLTLTELRPEDRAAVRGILTDRQVAQTYMLPDLSDEEQADRLFERLQELSLAPERYVRAIRKDEQVIGFVNDVQITGESIELGWVVQPGFQNRGYATEAVSAALEELACRGFTEITAGAFEENPASIRVMEKCGMTLQDKTEEITYRGRTHRCVYYRWGKNVMEDFTVNEMLGMQRELQEKYRDIWEPICPETGHNKLLWMVGEIGEVIDIVKKNGDRKASENPALRKALVEEMADVLMYYHDIMLCYGITPEELKQAYVQKFQRNMTRW